VVHDMGRESNCQCSQYNSTVASFIFMYTPLPASIDNRVVLTGDE